jgi:PAS domain S-box-containing protein
MVPERLDGHVHTVLAITRDLNSVVEAQAQKVASEALLKAAEQAAHSGSYQLDLATGTLRISEGLYHLFGEEPSSFVPTAAYINSRTHPADVAVVQQVLDQAVRDQQPYYYRRRIYLPDRQLRLLEARGNVVSNAVGQPLKLLGVVQDVTERQQAEQERLQAVLEVQEEERRRIAESLLNGLGQLLFATKLQLDHLPSASQTVPQQEARRLLAEAIRQSRTLSYELSLTRCKKQDLCRSRSNGTLRWQCHVVLDEGRPLPPALQLGLYRLAQELVQNVSQHAQATQATLELDVLPEWVVLRVEDNGCGFDYPLTEQGLSPRMLYRRVTLLDGTIELDSAPGEGTQVRVRIPSSVLPTS